MRSVGIFLAGVATGWVVRSSFDSFRDLAVNGLTAWYDMNERARRFVAVEREYFEDLVAEARSKFESKRARRTAKRAQAMRQTKPAATAQA
jgi:hypothetical protein